MHWKTNIILSILKNSFTKTTFSFYVLVSIILKNGKQSILLLQAFLFHSEMFLTACNSFYDIRIKRIANFLELAAFIPNRENLYIKSCFSFFKSWNRINLPRNPIDLNRISVGPSLQRRLWSNLFRINYSLLSFSVNAIVHL